METELLSFVGIVSLLVAFLIEILIIKIAIGWVMKKKITWFNALLIVLVIFFLKAIVVLALAAAGIGIMMVV